jgi:hypothetical protein
VTDEKLFEVEINSMLLHKKEPKSCKKIVSLDEGYISLRAKALLLLNQGITQPQVAEQTGLTLGQIRYLLRTFKQKRLGMFPEEILAKIKKKEKEKDQKSKSKAKKKDKKKKTVKKKKNKKKEKKKTKKSKKTKK